MIQSTALAKAAFWLSGKTRRIKLYQRWYRLEWDDPDDEPRMEFGGWHWHPVVSNRLLRLSMWLDREHWDHWALVHEHCAPPTTCLHCGGLLCGWAPDPPD